MKSKASFLLLILLVLIWGFSWPINKIGFNYTSPFNFNELRFLIGTIASFIVVFFTKNFVIPQKRDLPIILIMAIFQMGLTMNLSNYGLSLMGAGRATFIVYTTSIWLIPLSAVFYRRIKKIELASLIIGVFGVIILISPWQKSWYTSGLWFGDLLILLASLSWAIGIFCARHMKWHRTPLQLLPWELLICTIGTVLFSSFQGVAFMPKDFSFPLLGTLLYSGCAVIGIGQWIMLLVSKQIKPSVVSFGLIFIPVVSLIVSYFFINEQISISLISGVIIIITGVLLHVYAEKETVKKPEKYPDVP